MPPARRQYQPVAHLANCSGHFCLPPLLRQLADVAAARTDWRKRLRMAGMRSRRSRQASTRVRTASSLSAMRFCSLRGATATCRARKKSPLTAVKWSPCPAPKPRLNVPEEMQQVLLGIVHLRESQQVLVRYSTFPWQGSWDLPVHARRGDVTCICDLLASEHTSDCGIERTNSALPWKKGSLHLGRCRSASRATAPFRRRRCRQAANLSRR